MTATVSFSPAQPRFAARHDERRSTPYTYPPRHTFDVDDTYTSYHSQQNGRHEDNAPQEGALKRAAKKTGAILGVGGVIAAVTSPLWAPILGVGLACNNNAPEGAIAKIKPVAGWGPAVADAMCPSVFVMPNGDTYSNNVPSWKDFSQTGHVYPSGLVTDQTSVKGAYVNGSFFDGGLIKGLQNAQIASNDPEFFNVTVLEGAAPTKKVDEDGTVKAARAHLGFHQREGSVKLIGDLKGKSLKDLPKAQSDMLKAAAAAHSYPGAAS